METKNEGAEGATKQEVIAALNEAAANLNGASIGWTHEVAAMKRAASMLSRATVWTLCSEQPPTIEDGDKFGMINTMLYDGRIVQERVAVVLRMPLDFAIAWLRIEPLEVI